MKYDPQKHHRRSIRLAGYDYSQSGAYFVTLCTWQFACLFGEVVGEQLRLSALGKIVYEEWLRSAATRREIRLNADEFVVMPNHLHGIVWIVEPVGAHGVRPDIVCPDDGILDEHGHTDGVLAANHAPLHEHQRRPHSLSSFVAGFKAKVTSRARLELDMTGIWQRNFYEHIIRNEADLKRIRDYIEANPDRWLADQLHPAASPNPFNQDITRG